MQPTTPATTPAPQSVALSNIELKLELVKTPAPVYYRAQRWVWWGEQHSFMRKVEALIRNSPTAAALFNRKTALVVGDGLKVNLAHPSGRALQQFLNKTAPSGKYRTGDALLGEVARDNTRLRGRAYQVVWAADGEHIAEIHPQPLRTVASGPLNDAGDVDYYWICRDWRKRNQYEAKQLPAFNPDRAKLRGPAPAGSPAGTLGPLVEPVQLLVKMRGGGENEYYPDLDFEASLKYMELEAALADYHGGNVASNFSANTIITLARGPQDRIDSATGETVTAKQQRDEFERGLEKKYSGPGGKRIMVIYGTTDTLTAKDMAEITPFGLTGADALYTTYAALAQQAILSAGSCTSPVVAGLPGAGGLGDKGTELREAFDLFYNAVCKPEQNELLADLKELLMYVPGVDFTTEDPQKPLLSIVTTLPVRFTYSENMLELLKTRDELRADMGLDPLPAGKAPVVEGVPAPPSGAPQHPTATPAA